MGILYLECKQYYKLMMLQNKLFFPVVNNKIYVVDLKGSKNMY